jgi:small subunit ribosomal protein S6
MGHYFIMQFDSSTAVQAEVRRTLGLDPRMIRFSVVKLGDKLGTKQSAVEHTDGKIEWKNAKFDADTFDLRGMGGLAGLL